MKDWLVYFFGSFFSNKRVIKNAGRSFANAALALLMAIVILFSGLFFGNILAFPYHLEKAENYTQAIQNAFDNGLVLTIQDGVATSDQIVNTFENEADAVLYKYNEVELVVDTRNITQLYVFVDIKAIRNDEDLPYDAYLELSDEERQSYSLTVSVTNDMIDLAAFHDTAESYLDQVTNAQSPDFLSEIADEYRAMKQNQSLTAEEFDQRLYLLYARAYYPDLTGYGLSPAPTLRDYYSSLDSNDIPYLLVYSDMCIGSLISNDSSIDFIGYYFTIDGFSSETDPMQTGILEAFRSAHGVTALIYVINLMQTFLYVMFLWVILTVMVFMFSKIFKLNSAGNLFGDLTMVGNLLVVTSFISGSTGFISSFFASKEIAYLLTTLSVYLILMVRTLWFLVPEIIKQVRINKKTKAND